VEYVTEEGELFDNSIAHEVFMDVEFVPTILHLIEEVFHIKGFIASCIAEGEEALEGHRNVQQYKFFVDSSGCSMMKYKIHCIDND
jgi:hypothetical protein